MLKDETLYYAHYRLLFLINFNKFSYHETVNINIKIISGEFTSESTGGNNFLINFKCVYVALCTFIYKCVFGNVNFSLSNSYIFFPLSSGASDVWCDRCASGGSRCVESLFLAFV